ncbi:hypothetical protein HG530_011349 [Fusarium avenaceum]|nr:hypothetical protein HG530_011349 [Fusarium avenaceum]
MLPRTIFTEHANHVEKDLTAALASAYLELHQQNRGHVTRRQIHAFKTLVDHKRFTVGAVFEQPSQGIEDVVTLPVSKSCAVGSVPAVIPLVHILKKKLNWSIATQSWPVPHDASGRRIEIFAFLHHGHVSDTDSIVELLKVLSTVEVRMDDDIHNTASLHEMAKSASAIALGVDELGDLDDDLGGQKS